MSGFDDDWQPVVCRHLDALFDDAGAGFSRSSEAKNGQVEDMLWETDPISFAERYPDSGIEESYGSQWPPHCIDFWIYVDVNRRLARLSTEGLHARFDKIPLTGRSDVDARAIGEVVAPILVGDS